MNSDELAWTLYFPNKEYCVNPQCSASATRIVVQVGVTFDPEDFARMMEISSLASLTTPPFACNIKAKPEVRVIPVCEQHEEEIKKGVHKDDKI